jgi:hypothetical protein
MVKSSVVIILILVGIGLFLGMSSGPDQWLVSSPTISSQSQDAFQKFIANTARYYVAMFSTKKKGEDVLALLDKGELRRLDQSGKLQALIQGERGGVLLVMSALTSGEARGLAGPLRGKKAKTVSLEIRPAIASKSFTDPKERKSVLNTEMEAYEALYFVKGGAWVSEGNETSRTVIPKHVALIGSLHEEGVIKVFLAFEDSDDPRGFFIFTGKSRGEIKDIMKDDPIVKADWGVFDYVSCVVPEGTFK